MVVGSRPTARRALLAIVVLVSMLTLVACGRGPTKYPEDEPVPALPGNKFEVTLTDDRITPDNMSAAMGPITFVIKNEGTKVHNLAVDDNGQHFQSPDVQPGEEITWTVVLGTPSPVSFYSTHGDDRAQGLEANVLIRTGK